MRPLVSPAARNCRDDPATPRPIGAAGNHNLLTLGPPGGGKSLLARLLPTFDSRVRKGIAHRAAALRVIEPIDAAYRAAIVCPELETASCFAWHAFCSRLGEQALP